MAGTKDRKESDTDEMDIAKTVDVESEEAESEVAENNDASEQALADSNDRYLRLAAEFENYKKRVAREYERIADSASEQTLLGVLEVIDNFERALNTTEEYQQEGSMDTQKLFESLHRGARMIHQQLLGVLESHGVREIEAQGKPFDPALHEAALQIESDLPSEHVAGVLSKGYIRGDRVLRHAKVSVSKGESSPVADSNNDKKRSKEE